MKRSTYEDILGVALLNGGDDSSGNHELFPGLVEVKVVNSVLVALVNVTFHTLGAVVSSDVNLNAMYKKLSQNRGKNHFCIV